MLKIVAFLLIFGILGSKVCEVVKSNPSTFSGDIEFNVRNVPVNPVFLPKYRMEHAERNTSKAYDYWKQMDINFIEWPGNITTLEVDYPLLQWGKRAKLISSPCNVPLGMDFKAYAFKYVHLTWGSFRMTSSYCPPFKLPRTTFQGQLLPSGNDSTKISATDFEFASDSLLIIVESQFIIRLGDLERSHRNEGKSPIPNPNILSYTLAKGLTSPVTKLVTQNCCKNRMTQTCLYGDLVMAINQRSATHDVFISTDTGTSFKKIGLRPSTSTLLHSALVFPRQETILALHGSRDLINISHYSLDTGRLLRSKNSTLKVTGNVQVKQLGEEDSIVVWDNCSVWYSYNTGLNFSKALFYVHNDIQKSVPGNDKSNSSKHRISRKYCHLGSDSTVAYDPVAGKLAILDSHNNLFYGIDTKTPLFPLIGSNVDMTLLLPSKIRSIVPAFDFNNRPKLMYPPRYLYSEDEAYKDQNYKKRLGMRLFPRSVFPSDFMPPFYVENIPKRFKDKFGLKKCQTSSIIIDSALSQKPKIFYTPENSALNFTVEFKSASNQSGQLNWWPKLDKNLIISSAVQDFMRLGVKEYFYFKYIVTVLPKPLAFEGSLFRLNFYTVKSVRCVHQPQVTVWIRIEKKSESDFRQKENFKTSLSDPEPVRELRHFLNSTEVRKILHEQNPLTIQQCSRKFSNQ